MALTEAILLAWPMLWLFSTMYFVREKQSAVICIGGGFLVGTLIAAAFLYLVLFPIWTIAIISLIVGWLTYKKALFTKRVTDQGHELLRTAFFVLAIPVIPVFVVGISQTLFDETPEQKAACRTDLGCWAEKNRLEAQLRCQNNLEQRAKYDFRWTNEGFSSILTKHKWLDKEQGTIAYFGDKLQLQNGFGAWSNYRYRCDFAPSTTELTGLVAEQGYL